ncbi:hypothetical protein SAMN02799643_03622 [Methylobacterium sp. UNCCL125]|jgi:hypothetical protein|nr:hypothetical protein SAMN02799643_03622 [Methylobacterium sp. UNCCL125]
MRAAKIADLEGMAARIADPTTLPEVIGWRSEIQKGVAALPPSLGELVRARSVVRNPARGAAAPRDVGLGPGPP